MKVHFREDFGRGELIKEDVGGRNGVPVLESDCVEPTVVDAESNFASFFWYEQYWRAGT